MKCHRCSSTLAILAAVQRQATGPFPRCGSPRCRSSRTHTVSGGSHLSTASLETTARPRPDDAREPREGLRRRCRDVAGQHRRQSVDGVRETGLRVVRAARGVLDRRPPQRPKCPRPQRPAAPGAQTPRPPHRRMRGTPLPRLASRACRSSAKGEPCLVVFAVRATPENVTRQSQRSYYLPLQRSSVTSGV